MLKNKKQNNKKIDLKQSYSVLFLTTVTLLINFWAWTVLSPLASDYSQKFYLNSFFTALLVAMPVIIGSFGRIIVGLLADKFGGKKLIVLICYLTSIVLVCLAKVSSIPQLFMMSLALGIAGTSFSAGTLLINAWFPKNKRGLALGIYAFGNAGAAISGLATLRIVNVVSNAKFYYLLAGLLVLCGLLVTWLVSESPAWKPAKNSALHRFQQALKWKLTWRLSLLYALAFGGFVALGLYLPILLKQTYSISASEAGLKTAGFVLLSTLCRPVGGWLSDKLSGLVVLRTVFVIITGLAVMAVFQPALFPFGTFIYLGLGVMFGLGNGAIFAVIGHRCDQKIVGSVTGIIGAAGGIGGYLPTLIMGASMQLMHSYSFAFGLLAVTSFFVAISLRRLFGFSKAY